MKISRFIKNLENFQSEHGDCVVVTRDEMCCDTIILGNGYGTKYGDICVLEGDFIEEQKEPSQQNQSRCCR